MLGAWPSVIPPPHKLANHNAVPSDTGLPLLALRRCEMRDFLHVADDSPLLWHRVRIHSASGAQRYQLTEIIS
ncbi:unnamed protein product, partial [Iphiclides podalirius]